MRVAIHQPEHLPWLGYFAKMDAADLLIHLDDVQFEKNYFQNRNRVVDERGEVHWLTVSTERPSGHRTMIKDILIGDRAIWLPGYVGKLNHCMRTSRFHDVVCDWLVPELVHGPALADLNCRLIDDLAGWMGIRTEGRRSSEFEVSTAKTARLIDILQQCSATEYLIGRGSLDYLEFDLFRRASIDVILVEYENLFNTTVDGQPLSTLQRLCELGPNGIEKPRFKLSRLR